MVRIVAKPGHQWCYFTSRHAFASCCLWGEAGKLGISGIWVFKGQQLAFEHSEDWQVNCLPCIKRSFQVLIFDECNLFNRWTMPAMIGLSSIPLFLPPAPLSTSTWGHTSDLLICWIQCIFIYRWEGVDQEGRKFCHGKIFKWLKLNTSEKYNEKYNKRVVSVWCIWGTNWFNISTHWWRLCEWEEAPHHPRTSGCSCPCRGMLYKAGQEMLLEHLFHVGVSDGSTLDLLFACRLSFKRNVLCFYLL